MKNSATDPEAIDKLCMGLNRWREDLVQEEDELTKQQTNIGWEGILEGMLGVHWQVRQDEFFKYLSLKKTGVTWAKLVKSSWGPRIS
jgi:hypothetical protein